MTVTPSQLRDIPLFHNIDDAFLQRLIDVFQVEKLSKGAVLFEAGKAATRLLILVEGSVELRNDGEVLFTLHPIAPIGELGALTGLKRNTTAVVVEPSVVWSIERDKLMTFFERHPEVAFPFYRNLLQVVSDKIRRDEKRIAEMRRNIVRTQKAMKKVRDFVLDSEESVLSEPVFETLQDLIEHNRKSHYMVEPAHTLVASVRYDDGKVVPVLELSDGWAHLPPNGLAKGDSWSAVLVLPTGEIPLSGTVDEVGDEGAMIKLDMLIDEYQEKLTDYLTRVHMLDFVV